MATNETLRKTLHPIDGHRARINALQIAPHLTRLPNFMNDECEHKKSLRAIQAIPDEINTAMLIQIGRNSNWREQEVKILLSNGFSLFVGDDFLLKCKYAADFRIGEGLTMSVKDDRWDKRIIYTGDVPDSVIAKVVKIYNLETHSHYRTYTGSLGTQNLFEDLEYLVVSTSPLPVTSLFIQVDPFLLVFRRKDDTRPMIEASENGRIKKIRQSVGKYGFLIVGMWDMGREILCDSS